ncbi:hypothetical protein WAC35_29250, partial [Klebsiella pneumoniae]
RAPRGKAQGDAAFGRLVDHHQINAHCRPPPEAIVALKWGEPMRLTSSGLDRSRIGRERRALRIRLDEDALMPVEIKM